MTNYKLMPKEPTQEQLDRVMGIVTGYSGDYGRFNDYLDEKTAREVYATFWAYAPDVQGEPVASVPVAAQQRFRHPQITSPDWSIWQPAPISLDRPSWEIDSQGYEVEYRLLYATPQPMPDVSALVEALSALRRCIMETRGPDAHSALELADAALATYRKGTES